MVIKSIKLPENIRRFIELVEWTFAKTMPKWPHEYIVRKNVEENLFIQFVKIIRTNGYDGNFYTKKLTYLEHNERVYWTMGAPIEETVIINRCRKEDSFDYRLKKGTLPN